jgi:hypothetical protein
MLHLTGNPVTDFNAWVATLKPQAASLAGVAFPPKA